MAALAEMQIEPEHRGAAGDEVALIPPRQIAAGIRLKQRIAVPQCGCEQHQRDGGGANPDPDRARRASLQRVRGNASSPRSRLPCPKRTARENPPKVGLRLDLAPISTNLMQTGPAVQPLVDVHLGTSGLGTKLFLRAKVIRKPRRI